MHVIKMPDIGEGIAEVELVAWHVKPGDDVAEDQVLADVMTDKANVEIPSPVVGKVLALGGEVGQTLAVGSELIRIEVAGEGRTAPAPAVAREETPRAAPAAPEPEPAAPRAPAAASPASAGDRPIASPSVRRRAWELEVDLAEVRGTGLGGRIMHGDLDAHASRAGARPVRSPPPPAAAAREQAPRDDEQRVPVIGVRRKIAQKMQEAKRRIPHFTYVEEIDVTELESLRGQLNAKWGSARPRLTLLPFLARAMVLAVRDFPQINARFDDEAGVVTRHGAVHIGVATQTDAGLMVPVLRHAEALDLWAASTEITRLAEAARAGRVTRDELTGSTITITSLGAIGGIASTPVINHPEVAIVGVNRIVERPMMRRGAVVPRMMMNLSSSFDHRVVDGLHAAEFVQAIRGLLEHPATLFVE
ncbi:dihydrolipoamide acetyltransferase family protein [Piscinibacter sp.]|uniref:dihydrolipoamide acetyltransferase family protein n=1 Tax=Piscinibacter sp. TaxID=1903157 RepID=UPI002CFB3329|nr:dihydrolipoamide acetyltransferase family protein [Albitalea sp.]HUG22783.1 dihydrolipoamide acetyltransferase family protein [Albitalea sp.]